MQRFVARIKPRREHPLYFEWQTATACLFVGDNDRSRAQVLADAEIRARGWERMEFVDRATLIDDRVRAEGGAVLAAYLNAQAGRIFYVEELDEIAFSTKQSSVRIAVPRLSESFMDHIVAIAGGHRIDVEHRGPNPPQTADYRIDDLILELKDLQSDALETRSRQLKLASLFRSRCRPDGSSVVDPSLLSTRERGQYQEIVGRPIRKRLLAASHQIRATLTQLGDANLAGGAILLNTGYGSVSHDELVLISSRHVARSTTLQVLVCVSASTLTNGLDTVANFAFHPAEGGEPAVRRLREAFMKGLNEMMTEAVRSGFASSSPKSEPRRPIVFEDGSEVFTIPAPKPPNSVPSPE